MFSLQSDSKPDLEERQSTVARNEKYFSKVVGKALDILELVKRSPTHLTLKEITHHVGMAKSSVFRILHTLEVAGYISKDDSSRYSVAVSAKPWISRYIVKELVGVARPRMWELRRRFTETVSLGMLFDNHIEVIAVVESPWLLRMGNTVGRIIPPHASSIGKAICAFQSEARCEELLRSYGLHRFSEKTITDEIELKKEYEKIRQAGWSFDNGESTAEGFCFGVPVFIGQTAAAAMSISIPENRLPEEDAREVLITALRKASSEISEEVAEKPTPLMAPNR